MAREVYKEGKCGREEKKEKQKEKRKEKKRKKERKKERNWGVRLDLIASNF